MSSRSQFGSAGVELPEAERVEKALAIARVILASFSAVAIYVDPTEPSRFYTFAYSFLIGYIIYSFGLLLFPKADFFRPVRVQLIDVLWVSALIAATDSTSSPFFLFYTFSLIAAAYRWGIWQSVANGVLVVVALFTVSLAALGGPLEMNRFAIRSIYLILVSVILGYLVENEKRLRRENALIARAMVKAKAEFGLTQSMLGSLNEIRSFYDADAAVFSAEELASGNIYVLGVPYTDMRGEFGRFVELDSSRRFLYFFPINGESWHSVTKRGGIHETRCLDAHGRPTPDRKLDYPPEFVNLHRFDSLLGAKFSFGQEVTGRLFILNPKLNLDRSQELGFIQRVVRSVMPTLYNVYLWRRLRARAGAIERARLSRDLHDGIIQSLIGLEMQLDVMRHRSETGDSPTPSELERVQHLVRAEVKEVRHLMNALRQPRVEPSELVNFMSEQVDKFGLETGISAKFVTETDKLPLPPEVCRELVQILQEALMNVRKHSGAKHLLVRLSAPEDDWNLAIIDDGRGFKFEGRLTQSQLDARNLGPLVIRERVRLIRGELEIESVPGHGARLDVRLPKRIYA